MCKNGPTLLQQVMTMESLKCA
jgi:hypothetical protein